MNKEKIAERKALALQMLVNGMEIQGFSQKIAEALGIHISLLYRIRSGEKSLTLENAELIISHAPRITKRISQKV